MLKINHLLFQSTTTYYMLFYVGLKAKIIRSNNKQSLERRGAKLILSCN